MSPLPTPDLDLVFALLCIQVVLGALDNVWHHELTERLPSKPSARHELKLHAAREAIYGVIFLGLGWYAWGGVLAWLLAGLLLAELVITMADFVIEDRTRRLPAFERILHTVLAINVGAFMLALWPVIVDWAALPDGLHAVDHGAWAWFWTLAGVGVLVWAVRDSIAVLQLTVRAVPEWQRRPFARGTNAHPRTWLVTGGTGFVGDALVRHLVGFGDHAIVLTRDLDRAADRFGPHVEAVTDLDAIPADRHIHRVINLAGEPLAGGLWTAARRQRFHDSRIGTTRALIALIERLEHRPEVLINGSAIGYYGDAGERALTEEAPAGDDLAARLCRDWEAEALKAEPFGVRVVRLRLGLVLDREGGLLAQLVRATRMGGGTVLGTGRQWQSWIARADLIWLIRFCAEHGEMGGAVNAVAPEPVTQRTFTRALARRLHRPVLLRVPAFVLRLGLGGLSELFLASQRVIPARLERHAFDFRAPTLEKALQRCLDPKVARRDAGHAVALFNQTCPVCSIEAKACRRQIGRASEPVALDIAHLEDHAELIARYGFTTRELSKRLYVLEPDGELVGGIDAMLRIWRRIPAYRWRARIVGLPGVHLLAMALYEGIVAPAIDGRFGVGRSQPPRRGHDIAAG